MIAVLLLARFLFALILLALVGTFIWTAWRLPAERERQSQGRWHR